MCHTVLNRSPQHLILSALLLVGSIRSVFSLPITIKSDIVRKADGAPGLGRGYSLTTNTVYSNCLNSTLNETEHSNSYNFDYHVSGILDRSSLSGPISKSFGFNKVKAALNSEPTQPRFTRYHIAATMRLERFFSSVWESTTSLKLDAAKMVTDEEFANFFMTCGPNYIRSLERAQEVTAIIGFETDDAAKARNFSHLLKMFVRGNGFTATGTMDLSYFGEDASALLNTVTIDIFGYGLGLNPQGEDTLVATGLLEFNSVMRFAYDSMTKNDEIDSPNPEQTGMVHSMEVIPWSDNAEFLKLANVDFNHILAPVPRHAVPDALVDNESESFFCEDPLHDPDVTNKCCERFEKKNITLGTGQMMEFCDAREYLSPVSMRDNIETNAEFFALIGSTSRKKTNALATLDQCVSSLREFPEQSDYDILASSQQANYDPAIDTSYTVKELRGALDPTKDGMLFAYLTQEIDEYNEMFIQPCLNAIYGSTLTNDGSTDPKNFMADAWYNHEECKRPSCLENNMAWDRLNGDGCVRGIMSRKDSSAAKPTSSDPFCAKKIDLETGSQVCKYVPAPSSMALIDTCRDSLPMSRNGRDVEIPVTVSYLMDYFCIPESTGIIADSAKMDQVDQTATACGV